MGLQTKMPRREREEKPTGLQIHANSVKFRHFKLEGRPWLDTQEHNLENQGMGTEMDPISGKVIEGRLLYLKRAKLVIPSLLHMRDRLPANIVPLLYTEDRLTVRHPHPMHRTMGVPSALMRRER